MDSATIQQEIALRIINENIPRIVQCVEMLSDTQINAVPSAFGNSIGQLVLHLNGNVRQWLLKNLCEIPFDRKRNVELSSSTCTSTALIACLQYLSKDLQLHLKKITPQKLNAKMNIQGIEGTGFSAVIHVIEHFSYHTGQIALLTKLHTQKDLGFYKHLADIDTA